MLRVDNLQVSFGSGDHASQAVRDLSFSVAGGESFGIVGESGSGKSTVLNCIAGLLHAWRGRITVDGQVVCRRRPLALYRKLQMVFQDPFGSLHPRHTVDRALQEPLAIHGLGGANHRIEQILREVGLGPHLRFRYPHQLSGGQRQRVAVARALILEPEILLLDEPTSALDVSIQAEVLNLLQDLRRSRGLTYVLVSHNLAVVAHMCRRILVMNRGALVEIVTREQLRQGTVREEYTRQLLVASHGYDRAAIDRFRDL